MRPSGLATTPSGADPRTTSLAAPPHSLSSSPSPDPDMPPPSYDDTRSNEPHNPRFGRWRNWVEKRGAETRQLRDNVVEKSSWNLDGNDHRQRSLSETEEQSIRAARARDDAIEKRLSASQYSIPNSDDFLRPSAAASASARPQRSRSGSATPSVGGGTATSRLTRHVTIEQLGSRFDRGLADKPLCGMILPSQPTQANVEQEQDRFLLVGTARGLVVVDLDPPLNSSNHAASSSSTSPAIRILPLFTGIGVHHLEHFVEPARPKSEGAKGLLIGLVGNEAGDGFEVRMWSLAAIVYLVKWRIYNNEASRVFDLTPAPTNSVPHNRNGSFSTFKTFLSSPSTKGKNKQLSPDSASTPSPLPEAALDTARRPIKPSRPTQSNPEKSDDLPAEWLNAHVKLPLPKPHTPILFFNLAYMPPRTNVDTVNPDQEECSDSDSDVEDLTNEQMRKRAKEREEQEKLFLLVATKGVIYLFESYSEQKRSWKLTRELTAPSTPRFLQLVRFPDTSPTTLHATFERPLQASRVSSPSSTKETVPYPADLCLLLGLSHRSVLVRLSDYSVTEFATPSSSGHLPLSRARTKSLTNSIKSTASGHHRACPSLNLNILDHPIIKKVQQAIDNKEVNVPHGFRGEKNIALGRKLSEGNESRESVPRLSPSVAADSDGEGRWIGAQEIIVRFGHGNRNLARFQLVTKGHKTFLLATPLRSSPTSLHPSESSSLSTPLLSLSPLYTFNWPTDLSIRRVTCSVTSEPRRHRSHIVLVAFTTTGLSVQEGYLSHSAIVNSSSSSSTPIFSPTLLSSSTSNLSRLSLNDPLPSRTNIEASRLRDENEEDDDDKDLSGSCSLDFGTESMWLADSLSSSTSASAATRLGGRGQRHSVSSPPPSSSYMYTRSNADYVIKRIRVV